MKLRLTSAACAISLVAGAANAQSVIDMSKFTCAQYLAMSPAVSEKFSAWMSGWFTYHANKTLVDMNQHEKNMASLRAWCQTRPQVNVMTALKESIERQQ
jgi:HdeA/HdeB family